MRHPAVLLPLFGILSTATAFAQDPTPLRASQVPLRATTANAFVPRGWHIEKQINGDLNGDQRPDAALVLVQNKPTHDNADNPAPRARALILALREGKMWRRAGFNGTLLYGTRDGGAFYGIVETPVTVSISKGVIVVEQEAGSREVSETTYRFRFDTKQNRFALIGYDSNTRDRATGDIESTSINFLTGRKAVTKMRATDDKTTTKISKSNRRVYYLETIKGDEEF